MAQLFRKQALDTLSTPEQLDKQVVIMHPAVWVLYTAIVIGFLTFLVWCFTYRLTDSTKMSGVIFTNRNVVTSYADRDCIITDVLVKEGDEVKIGDIIAVVSNKTLLERISDIRLKLDQTEPNSVNNRKLQESLDSMIEQYIASTVIKADADGYIQSIKVRGTSLAPGDSMFSIMASGGYNEVIAYVPIQTATHLSLGMPAQISPNFAPREEYGYMSGAITSISAFPVSEEIIIDRMGSLSYVSDILPEESFVEVCIRLDIDKNSKNTYSWSNAKGEELSVKLGTPCSIIVVTNEYMPAELLAR